ncbi:hypothetical protein VNO78_35013 [Psophocarpus tetragonolobus]|uniref:Cupin type-1 domain-containing protein n=1 Tax=Psophocarpus tetragonolobus TaxID=3891 RepID=A0AAN9RLL1_PSOTE
MGKNYIAIAKVSNGFGLDLSEKFRVSKTLKPPIRHTHFFCLLCLSWLLVPNVNINFMDLLDISHFSYSTPNRFRLHGLGLAAIGFDWSSICSFLGSPLASPWFANANVATGFSIFVYVIMPIAYWSNLHKARRFPIFSDDLFKSNGKKYNISTIIDSNFHLDKEAFEHEGPNPLYLSTMFAMSYVNGFACLSATLVHVLFFHGNVWECEHDPRAAELLFLVSGSLQVGFVDTKRTLYTQNLQPGDMFIFPKGLIHYQYNSQSVSATAISAFGSANAGTVSIPLSLFSTGIDDVILAKAFKTDTYTIKKIRSCLNKP